MTPQSQPLWSSFLFSIFFSMRPFPQKSKCQVTKFSYKTIPDIWLFFPFINNAIYFGRSMLEHSPGHCRLVLFGLKLHSFLRLFGYPASFYIPKGHTSWRFFLAMSNCGWSDPPFAGKQRRCCMILHLKTKEVFLRSWLQ